MFSSKKPYSSVTVAIERLTSEQFEEDDLSGIPDLVEAITLQSTGPTEAARAIRKKLKYGNVHRQLRALTILDGLMQNAGSRFQRAFVDEPLLERLRVCATSPMSEKEVRARCQVLFAGWGHTYKSTPGMERIARLNKELPKRKQVVTQDRSKVLKETERDPFEDEEDEEAGQSSSRSAAPSPTPGAAAKSSKSKPSSSGISSSLFSSSTTPTKSKKSKKGAKSKSGPFNLEAEKGNMKTNIAESSVASINLLNALQRINREEERVSENQTCVAQFERCKLLRRHILRYIQNVEAEEWLGALIQANDQLVTALMTFEQLDSSIDADSDSDDELAEQAHAYRMLQEKGKAVDGAAAELAGLKLGSGSASPAPVAPPRPAAPPAADDYDSVEEEDDDNPFGDANALESPALERDEPKCMVDSVNAGRAGGDVLCGLDTIVLDA
ncbi:hypothetical protein V500_10572 [Pseudogymnoascus sp. VKM F-4518 (FW-2643)]|nr:hypothetical protein V500_10572 [Pseudogymnoascus sp. VKM F-4518 (FW-2643)]